jgi:(2Fe-2S) ferredoxin
MTATRIPLFVKQHLLGNEPVAEWVFARNPLPRANGMAE